MKKLAVPYLASLNISDLQQASDILEEKGNRGSIESVNWVKEFGYMPITFFTIARSMDHLFIRFQVRGNVLRAVYTKDGSPVWEDSCVGFYCREKAKDYYMVYDFNCIGTCFAEIRSLTGMNIPIRNTDMLKIERYSSLESKPFNELDGMFSWSLLVKIPFRLMGLDMDHLPNEIEANFIKCADATSLRHYVSWNPIVSKTPDFEHPEAFGKLIFE